MCQSHIEEERMVPSVTIEKSSVIRLPKELVRRFRIRSPRAELHFDPENKLIGIAPRRKGSVRLHHFSRSASVHARYFLRDCKVVVENQSRFRCWWDEEMKMLVIDISRPAPIGRPKKERPAA